MGKKVKVGKARRDKYYQLAKESGFRSRAAFKLIQLNRHFNFLGSSKVLIDLCAAPGGWLQVAAKEMPISSLIVGIDLVPIQAIHGVKTLQADITTDKCVEMLKGELQTWKADVVLHDGAPNVGTAWSIDEFRQAQLCKHAFALATKFLRAGGWFITKVFRSRDYEPLRWALEQHFHSVKPYKPDASRLESAETFLVCRRYKAPQQIDTRFLDDNFIFKDVDEEEVKINIPALLKLHSGKKKKNKAEGYADGDGLYHELKTSQFFADPNYLDLFAKANKIVVDVPAVSEHPLTNANIRACLSDIKVLGPQEVKAVLKWRTQMVAALRAQVESDHPDPVAHPASTNADGQTEEEQVDKEIERLLEGEEKEKKKKMKKVRKAKAKLVQRIQMKMLHPGDYIEQTDDIDLFSLARVRELQTEVDTADTVDKLAEEEDAAAQRTAAARRKKAMGLVPAARSRFEKGGADHRNAGELGVDVASEDSDADSDPLAGNEDIVLDSDAGSIDDEEDWNESGDEEGGQHPLLVDLDPADQQTREKRQVDAWFTAHEFKELVDRKRSRTASEDDDSDQESYERMKLTARDKGGATAAVGQDEGGSKVKSRKRKRVEQQHEEADAECEEQERDTLKRKRPRPLTAEERALGSRLVRSAKSRRELLEWATNRYATHEGEGSLPAWFLEDERRHMRKPLPITTEEVQPDKPAIAGRTIKKVEEAKARKKAKMLRRLKKVRRRAENIPEDFSEKEKWSQIKQMYKKAGLLGNKREKPPVHYVVNTKQGSRSGPPPKGSRIKLVDKRMRADSRMRGGGSGRSRGGGSGRGRGGGSGRGRGKSGSGASFRGKGNKSAPANNSSRRGGKRR